MGIIFGFELDGLNLCEVRAVSQIRLKVVQKVGNDSRSCLHVKRGGSADRIDDEEADAEQIVAVCRRKAVIHFVSELATH